MRIRTITHVLIAGSSEASPEMLTYARRAVQRAYRLGWTVLVGDNPKGIDRAVVRECRRFKAKVIVAGTANFPRNFGCKHGQYVKVARELYRRRSARWLCRARSLAGRYVPARAVHLERPQ